MKPFFLIAVVVVLGAAHAAFAQPAAEPKTAKELIEIRSYHDRTIWSKEVQAQNYETTFVNLWDSLLREQDKFAVLKAFPFDSIQLPERWSSQILDWGIIQRKSTGSRRDASRADALALLESFEQAGYSILETEWHHSQFRPATEAKLATSVVSFLLHVVHDTKSQRFVLKGDLAVQWKSVPEEAEKVPLRLALTKLEILEHQGATAFEQQVVEAFDVATGGGPGPASIHPLLLHDLNGDGLTEIIVGGFNRVYWNKGDWKFEQAPLCDYPRPHVRASVLGDFTGDGVADYLCFPIGNAASLFVGNSAGKFVSPARSIGWRERLPKPSCVTAGDIDGDGDLDVFVGQQKSSYSSGFVPAPFYDANDGYRSYLLINQGDGTFRDGTALSGLGQKNRRHVFSSTFVDLDGDKDLDLVLTNDFCGCDLFFNDGRGSFEDKSDTIQPSRHGFGMSHSFGDYNLDGRLDMIMIGMSSTTARRLEQLGLGREDFADYDQKRPEMGYGNRLYLNQAEGLVQAPFNASCARTGWSWGSTTLDFDSDGDQDIYVCNGQISGQTTRDYCTRFWCHDVYYKADDSPQEAIQELFGKFSPIFSGRTISWNGYEHNALLMNLQGKDFVNAGFLMGVAFEFDARAAISGDIDGDGRVDLVVEHKDTRNQKRNLYVLRNTWDVGNHWIGAHLRTEGFPGESVHGATVAAVLPDGKVLTQHVLSGHSVWSQHAPSVHFGLGKQTRVDRLEVQWPSGKTTSVRTPDADQYHVFQPSR